MKKKTVLWIGLVLVVSSIFIQDFLSATGFTEIVVVSGGPIIETVHRLGALAGVLGFLTLFVAGALWLYREK